MAKLLAIFLFVATCIATSYANCGPGALLCQPVGGLGGLGALDYDLDLNLGLGLNHGLGLGPLARLNHLKKGPIIKPLLLKVPVPVAAAPQLALLPAPLPIALPAPLPAPLPVPAPAPVPPPAPLPKCGCIVPGCSCLTK